MISLLRTKKPDLRGENRVDNNKAFFVRLNMLQPFSSKVLRCEVGRSPGSPVSCLAFPSDLSGQWRRDISHSGITVAGQLPNQSVQPTAGLLLRNSLFIPFALSETGHQLQIIEKNKSLRTIYIAKKGLSRTNVTMLRVVGLFSAILSLIKANVVSASC